MKPFPRFVLASAASCFLFATAPRAADHCSGLILVDESAAAVILVPPLATVQELLWSGLPLVAPTDAVLEDDETLLIVDPGADAIFRFDWASGIEPVPFITGIPTDTCWILRLNDDEILLSGPGGLVSVNASTGGETALPTVVVDPVDIDFLPSGDVLVADPGAAELTSVDPVTWAGTAFSPGSTNSSVAVDPDGQVAAVGPDGVFLVDAQGGDPQLLTSGGFLSDPSAVVFGGHGNIYVADRGPAAGGGPTIVKVHPVTGEQTVVASGGFLVAPSAIVALDMGPALPALPASGQRVLVALLAGLVWAIWWNRRRASADG